MIRLYPEPCISEIMFEYRLIKLTDVLFSSIELCQLIICIVYKIRLYLYLNICVLLLINVHNYTILAGPLRNAQVK